MKILSEQGHGRLNISKFVVTFMSLLACLVALVACGGGGESTSGPVSNPLETESPAEAGEISMGGGALGGSAVTTLLAQEVLTPEETTGTLAWVAHEFQLGAGEALEHSHEYAFVYAATEPHLLTQESEAQRLEPTQGAAVRSGSAHRHEALSGPSVFWEIGLAAPGTPASPNKPNAVLVFESSTLGGIPGKPLCMCSYPPELRQASIPIRGRS